MNIKGSARNRFMALRKKKGSKAAGILIVNKIISRKSAFNAAESYAKKHPNQSVMVARMVRVKMVQRVP